MIYRLLLTLSLAISVLAGLKDLAHCDPLKKDTRCPPDPAFAGKAFFDFTKAGWNDAFHYFWTADPGSSKNNQLIDFNTDGRGAAFSVWEAGEAPTLASNKYFLFGKVSVEVLAAQGPGLITAIVLKSDSGDEIDWELLGAYENQAQPNYFYDGQALYNTYNNTYALSSSSFSSSHKYSVEWTSTYLRFSIDDSERKTWHIGDIPAHKWPQTPMQVKLGIWSVHNDSDPGEIAWAGGVPDWGNKDKIPYKAYFKTLEIEDYLGGCQEVEGGSGTDIEYQYDERTWGWQDVKIKGCKKRVVPGMYTPDVPPDQPTRTDDPMPYPPPEATGTQTPDTTGDTEEPSETGDGQESSESGEGGDKGDDKGAAPLARELSSPLAAVVLLCWLLML